VKKSKKEFACNLVLRALVLVCALKAGKSFVGGSMAEKAVNSLLLFI
jgi:hypothetical protein